MLQYKYSPLPTGSSIVRVLRLLPNEDNTIPINCQLIRYSLLTTDKGHHPYEALSYVWGSESKPQCIFIDGYALRVTDNLYTALLHLRDHQLPRMLWVDAICINQQDNQEKAHQIQFIPIIYADYSDKALENIRLAAEYEPTGDKSIILWEKETAAILILLRRPWFQRIWVLQEGLNLSYKADPGLENLIRSITYLMRGAIFRPKYIIQSHGTLSLVELIDMYHTREATKKYDKVYALLGMSSDAPNNVDLLPNYELPWNTLFNQIIASIFEEVHSVETWPNKEIAVIKAKGYILGRINSVDGDSSQYNRQCVQISFNTTPRSLRYESEWGTQWTLQASAKSIQEGDIVCLFQGASKPSIIRIANPQQNRQGGIVDKKIQKSIYAKEDLLRDILLIWNWEISRANSEKDDGSEIPVKFKDAAPDSETDLENKRSTIKLGSRGNQIVERLLDQNGLELPVSETVVKMVAGNTAWGDQIMQRLLKQRGNNLPISEEVVEIAAGNTGSGGRIMRQLLEQRGNNLPISEEIVKIAAGNTGRGDWIIQQLLEQRGNNLLISEEVVAYLSRNKTQCSRPRKLAYSHIKKQYAMLENIKIMQNARYSVVTIIYARGPPLQVHGQIGHQ
ncbi:heterokaryon incompatibility protein-domain-containing protein [Aspergillus alliaceus]|uniref:Heterokaryon incompatibility protein-domain-containing protein n=1 Tax=Petromyces alliaceus TaxID=209559 RepID=A0A5N7BTY3_PETAA|nr:heterokaryon incompatibility protein-domain-containing protein [Aspergillus alliaceus]